MKKARKATFQDLFPKATPAEPGFAPTIHLTGIMEADEMWLLEMFTAVGNYVVAYFALEPLPGCYSIELQFEASRDGKSAVNYVRAMVSNRPINATGA